MYVFQSFSGDNRTEELLSVLCKRDDDLVPVFCEALVKTGQAHVARMLGYKG